MPDSGEEDLNLGQELIKGKGAYEFSETIVDR